MKGKIILIGLVYLVGLIYLVLPSPSYPDLRDAGRSDEPGDTWQHPDQKGFYTNLDRTQVLTDLQNKFSIKLNSLNVPSYRLNYRPEEAFDYVRDQLQSYYLEEIVYPLRESLYVNGWEPKKSPQYAGLPAKSIPDISLHGVPYSAKITLRPVSSPVWARILVWTLIFPATYFVYLSFKKSLAKNV